MQVLERGIWLYVGMVGTTVGLVCGVLFDLALLCPLEPFFGGSTRHMLEAKADLDILKVLQNDVSRAETHPILVDMFLYYFARSSISCGNGIRIKCSIEVPHAWHDCLYHSEPLWGQFVLLVNWSDAIQQYNGRFLACTECL